MNLLNRNVLLLAIGVMLAVTACSGAAASPTPTPIPPTATTAPTPTPKPTDTPVPTDTPEPVAASGSACVVGTWELTDMGQYMASIMASAGASAEFEFSGQEGYLRYTFEPDGTATIDANGFVVNFDISVQDLTFDMAVSIDGTGTATYEADDGEMLFSDPNVDDLTFSATMAGNELFSGTSNELASLFGVSADGTSTAFTYECSGDMFTYVPPAGVPGVQPVVLTRVSP
jgi:hypothetical protein